MERGCRMVPFTPHTFTSIADRNVINKSKALCIIHDLHEIVVCGKYLGIDTRMSSCKIINKMGQLAIPFADTGPPALLDTFRLAGFMRWLLAPSGHRSIGGRSKNKNRRAPLSYKVSS